MHHISLHPPATVQAFSRGIEAAQDTTSSSQNNKRGTIENNAREYTSFLMSTFAKTMMETCKNEEESIDQEIMGSSLLGDALGKAMVDSGAGDLLRKDLLKSMLDMQGIKESQRLSSSRDESLSRSSLKGGSYETS